jgi:uncharacterized protein YbjT (DUF2867 family)
MKFVVTGAAGHVSRPLTERLLEKRHDVTMAHTASMTLVPSADVALRRSCSMSSTL